MTEMEVRNEILKKFLSEFNGDFPIETDNKILNKPATPATWVRINVKFNKENQDSLGIIGNRRYKGLGLIIIQVFTPINKGTNDNDTTANACKVLLDGIRIGSLHIYNGGVRTIGSDGEYYQQNVNFEFQFENIR